VKSRNYEAPHHAVFSNLVLVRSQHPSECVTSNWPVGFDNLSNFGAKFG